MSFLARTQRFLVRKWKLILFVLVVAAGAGFWFYRQQQTAQVILKTQQPQFQNLTKTLEVSGIIDAEEKANLRFAAGGKVTYLRYKEGDVVKKGTAIAVIDPRELQKRLQQDLNTYMRERYDWEQLGEDRKDTATTNEENRTMHKSQLDLNDTVLSVEIRDIAIQNTRLISPINGVLISSPTSVTGVNVLASEAFEVVNPDTLVFKAAVDETDIGSVKIGQPVKITLDAYPDQPLDSYVADIAYKSSQTTSGTVFVVKVPIKGTELLSRYRLGMNGDALITIDTRENVMTVPLDATKERDNKVYVTVKTGGTPGAETTEEREITIDMETDDHVEVLSGLKPEDEVVLPE